MSDCQLNCVALHHEHNQIIKVSKLAIFLVEFVIYFDITVGEIFDRFYVINKCGLSLFSI